MSVPGLSTLYAIFKRDIDRSNSILSKRLELAQELRKNSEQWVSFLMSTFDDAVVLYENEGKDAALSRIDDQIIDFMKLDYHSLREDSPILIYLDEDPRFNEFVNSCQQFYLSALNIKRLMFGGIKNMQGEYRSMQDEDIKEIISLYHSELESMHNLLVRSHNSLKTIEPK